MAWWAAVHGVAKSRTRLRDFTFTFHFHALEKEMATHSSVLAWRIPGMGDPGGLPSMGSHSRTRLKRLSSSSSSSRCIWGVELLSHMGTVLTILKNCKTVFQGLIHHLTLLPAVYAASNCPTSSQHLTISMSFIPASVHVKWHLWEVLI